MPKKISSARPLMHHDAPQSTPNLSAPLAREEDSFSVQTPRGLRKFAIIPPQSFRRESREQRLIEKPNYDDYRHLVSRFLRNYQELGKNNLAHLAPYVDPRNGDDEIALSKAELKLVHFHEEHDAKTEKECSKARAKAEKREQKIARKGAGFGGVTTKVVYDGKVLGRGVKDYATMRGWVFTTSDTIFGKSMFEMLPRYGARNGAYIGIRISEFAINTVFLAVGYGLIPVTYGISKPVSDHARSFVTVGGEALAYKILGAQNRKVFGHSALRAVHLEAMKLIPYGSDVIQYGEMGMQSLGNGAIALSYMSDLIMRGLSTRHVSYLTKRDLGDSRVVYELDHRIDYLSRFLIPYGQMMLLAEHDEGRKKSLGRMLKRQGKVLRKLEKTRAKTVRFYQLALLNGRVPEKLREGIMMDTLYAASFPRKNCMRVARQCLATLLASSKKNETIG